MHTPLHVTFYSRIRMNLLVLWMDVSYVDALEEGFSVCCSARVQVLITLTLKNGILLYLQCTHFIHTVGKPIGLQVLNEKCINEANWGTRQALLTDVIGALLTKGAHSTLDRTQQTLPMSSPDGTCQGRKAKHVGFQYGRFFLPSCCRRCKVAACSSLHSS